jgi:hypothetical protein
LRGRSAEAIYDDLAVILSPEILADNTMTKQFSEGQFGTARIASNREPGSLHLDHSDGDISVTFGDRSFSLVRQPAGVISLSCTMVHGRLTD